MVRVWSRVLMAGALILAVVGVFLYAWALPAGIVVHAIAAVLLFLGYRLGKQGSGLVEMAESLR